MTTTVPQPTFGATGFVAPLESAILAAVTAQINAAFGGNLNMSPATPQGQLAASITAMIANANDLFVLYTNMVDPMLTYGRMQDAIGRLSFIERNPAAQTIAQCLCIGAVGVTIPVGALAEGEDGNTYACTQSGTIPISGNITLPFACQTSGPIACGANNVTQIVSSIPGWDSINNPIAGVTGSAAENAQAFEARRGLSVAKNSTGWQASILGAVLAVPGVTDAYVMDNPAASPLTIGDYTIPANCLYVAVAGSAAQSAVALAIWQTKPPGIPMSGNTSVTVINPTPSPQLPPAFAITYNIPTPLAVVFSVIIANSAAIPSNATTLIQNAVANAATVLTGSISGTTLTVTTVTSGALSLGQILTDSTNEIEAGTVIVSQTSGTLGGIGVYVVNNSQTVASETMWASPTTPSTHIGQKVYASSYYSGIASLGSWAEIISVTIGSANSANAVFTGVISGPTLTVSAVASGTIAAGQALTDATQVIAAGTTILAQLTGTAGGAGTYTVSPAQSVGSETIYGIVPTSLIQTVYIDQSPVVYPANVSVTYA